MLLEPESQKINYWNRLYDAKDRNSIMTAYVTAIVEHETLKDPAWELEFRDIPYVRGLIPYGETGLSTKRLMDVFVGKEIQLKIKGIDRKNSLIACTRREVIEESFAQIARKVKDNLKDNLETEAVVSYITDRLVGIDIGRGVIINIDHQKAGIPRSIPLSALYMEGIFVKIVINKIDENTKDIEASIVDPWQGLRYPRGTVISCSVVHLGEKNIFVSARLGVVGIAPYPVDGKKPEIGEKIKLQVVKFDPSEKILRLRYHNPEVIKGRRKNRAYWKRYKEEKAQEAQK